ncbi:hypothetical protein B0H19DRAFT_1061752 [Mycena capillaripes]|nr:hypothetical protein B0H19DRAFT_1061752 [Mycena capillaripes]
MYPQDSKLENRCSSQVQTSLQLSRGSHRLPLCDAQSLKLLGTVLIACVVGTVAQSFTETVLLSPEVFNSSQCDALISVTCTEVDMRVAGSCTECRGNNVEITMEG